MSAMAPTENSASTVDSATEVRRLKKPGPSSVSSHGSGNFVPYPISSHGSGSPSNNNSRRKRTLETVEEGALLSLEYAPGRFLHGVLKRLDEFFYSNDIVSEAMRRLFPGFMIAILAGYLYLRAFTKERSALRGLIAILDKYPKSRVLIKVAFAAFGGYLTARSLYKELRIWIGVDPPVIRKSLLDDFNTGEVCVIQPRSSIMSDSSPEEMD